MNEDEPMNPVICTWSAELPAGTEVIWPDGCRDVIAIMPAGQPAALLCSALDESARHIQCQTATRFMGIRLAPGVRFAWEREAPAMLLSDRYLQRWSAPLLQLTDQHSEAQNSSTSTDNLLRYLQQQIDNHAITPPEWINAYLLELAEQDGDYRPPGASVHRPRSERNMRRLLVEYTGRPPRYWQQLARIRATARAIAGSDEPLAALAAEYHFADQAHMSRDIRRWLGCTPAMLRADNNGNDQRANNLARLSAPDAFTLI